MERSRCDRSVKCRAYYFWLQGKRESHDGLPETEEQQIHSSAGGVESDHLAIRDYYRLKEEADSIILSSPSPDGAPGKAGPGDPTYAKAV